MAESDSKVNIATFLNFVWFVRKVLRRPMTSD